MFLCKANLGNIMLHLQLKPKPCMKKGRLSSNRPFMSFKLKIQFIFRNNTDRTRTRVFYSTSKKNHAPTQSRR